jgi:uncharacterized protein YdiU (UPF0061 family)
MSAVEGVVFQRAGAAHTVWRRAAQGRATLRSHIQGPHSAHGDVTVPTTCAGGEGVFWGASSPP